MCSDRLNLSVNGQLISHIPPFDGCQAAWPNKWRVAYVISLSSPPSRNAASHPRDVAQE